MSISRSQAWGLSQMVKLHYSQCCRQRDILPPSTINTAARPEKVTQIMGYWWFRGSSFKIFPTQSFPKCSASWRLWYKIICMKTQLWSQCNLALTECWVLLLLPKWEWKYLWYCKREQWAMAMHFGRWGCHRWYQLWEHLCSLPSNHGIMGRRFPDGGLLRYREWVTFLL